ncbi:Pol polyprotein [Plakobranchus ocellatus]|uniref:Pol polyprotein n=1 Tax=Plakobranchus ocellatus TaxID=259542 RepID=A0AAV4AXY5_9GAST|nr:Pol polyprotein [Plakobranchus ocellatus]
MFSRFGTPSVLKTDNGPPFNGKEFSIFAQKYGFKHRKITPLWPEANGEAETFVRSLNKFIHTCQAEHSEWKEQLPNFLYQYRATPHSSTRLSPHEALTGKKMKTSLPEIIHQRNKPLQTIEDNDLSAKGRQKYHADKKRSNLDHKIQSLCHPDELDTPVELTQDDLPPQQSAPQLHPSGTQSEPLHPSSASLDEALPFHSPSTSQTQTNAQPYTVTRSGRVVILPTKYTM